MVDLEIPPREVHDRLQRGADLLLLDCREPEELRLARLQGAQHVPLQDIPAHSARLDAERETVVLCHHGVRSAKAAAFLRDQAGFTRVRSLRGGIDAWSREVDPTVPRY
jgi:rhodanese-related sulfurtransferase